MNPGLNPTVLNKPKVDFSSATNRYTINGDESRRKIRKVNSPHQHFQGGFGPYKGINEYW